jgi:hypothetical protein
MLRSDLLAIRSVYKHNTISGMDHDIWYGPQYLVWTTICGMDHNIWYGPQYVVWTTITGMDHNIWYGPQYLLDKPFSFTFKILLTV